jgi:hypothetical protein
MMTTMGALVMVAALQGTYFPAERDTPRPDQSARE